MIGWRKLDMKRRYQGIPIMLAAVCIMAGCGTEVPGGKEGQFVEAQGLNQALVSAIVPQKSPVTADESEDRVAELPQPEVTGSEAETEKRVVKTADIMSHAAENASRLGTVNEGEVLTVVGTVEEGGWIKVCYNGRIAYIYADVLEPDPTPTPEPTPRPANRGSSRPSGNTGTSRPSGGGNAGTSGQSGNGESAGQDNGSAAVPEENGGAAEEPPADNWVPEYAGNDSDEPENDNDGGEENGGEPGGGSGENEGGNPGGNGGEGEGGNPGGEPPVEEGNGNEGGEGGEGPAEGNDPPADYTGTVGDVSPDDYSSSTGEGVPSAE